MPPMIEFPLDLPEVRVLKTELKKREIVITVESTRPYAICSRCRQKTLEFHSYDDPIRCYLHFYRKGTLYFSKHLSKGLPSL
jgi:cytidine deaminase